MKHTPGPWQVIEDDYSYAVFQPSPGIGRAYICREISQGKDDGLADARLIAAAPDLLEALEELQEKWITQSHYWGSATNDKVEAAIRKARGL